uniref:Uncharacterized protein n=1 Tax=Rhizophora mucronata TaxID=61149 RepID=A0A2P2QY13_RHIMU
MKSTFNLDVNGSFFFSMLEWEFLLKYIYMGLLLFYSITSVFLVVLVYAELPSCMTT